MKQKLSVTSSPSIMRVALIVLSVLVIVLTVALAVFSRSYLVEYADEVASITAESENTQATVDSLTRAKESLAEQEDAVQKAKRIVAESKQYQYQNQIINDLTAYAEEANLSISSFVFSNTDSDAADAESQEDAAKQQQLAGLKTAQVTIGLPGQIAYKDLLNFLSLIENNATRMQVQGLLVSPQIGTVSGGTPAAPQSGNKNIVTVNSLTLGVYIR